MSKWQDNMVARATVVIASLTSASMTSKVAPGGRAPVAMANATVSGK